MDIFTKLLPTFQLNSVQTYHQKMKNSNPDALVTILKVRQLGMRYPRNASNAKESIQKYHMPNPTLLRYRAPTYSMISTKEQAERPPCCRQVKCVYIITSTILPSVVYAYTFNSCPRCNVYFKTSMDAPPVTDCVIAPFTVPCAILKGSRAFASKRDQR